MQHYLVTRRVLYDEVILVEAEDEEDARQKGCHLSPHGSRVEHSDLIEVMSIEDVEE